MSEVNRCPVSYPHQPHDRCDGTPAPNPLAALETLLSVIRDPDDGGLRLVGIISDRRTYAAIDQARRAVEVARGRRDGPAPLQVPPGRCEVHDEDDVTPTGDRQIPF